MGSIGGVKETDANEGLQDTLAFEAAHSMGQWRVLGQAGLTSGLTEDFSDQHYSTLYGVVQGQYFVNPNLMLTAELGASRTSTTDVGVPHSFYDGDLYWGAEVDYKPTGSPVILYAGYQGVAGHRTLSFSDNYSNYGENRVIAGIRLPIGGPDTSVQSLQTEVGLTDWNPQYGALSGFDY